MSKVYLLSNTITHIDYNSSGYDILVRLAMKYRTDEMRQQQSRIDYIRNYYGFIIQDITNQSSKLTTILDDKKTRTNKNDIISMFNVCNRYVLTINQL